MDSGILWMKMGLAFSRLDSDKSQGAVCLYAGFASPGLPEHRPLSRCWLNLSMLCAQCTVRSTRKCAHCAAHRNVRCTWLVIASLGSVWWY